MGVYNSSATRGLSESLAYFFEHKRKREKVLQLVRATVNSSAWSKSTQNSVLTIGNFDGVHLGHQVILNQVNEIARARNLSPQVMFFEPQPLEFFHGINSAVCVPARLMHWREKFEVLRPFGLDRVILARFEQRLSQMSAEAFVKKLLVDALKVKHLVIGSDFRFGAGREGDFAMLNMLARSLGFEVEQAQTLLYPVQQQSAQRRVSSTWIRALLSEGNLRLANQLLGRPFGMSARVVSGDRLGRTWGVPTANLALPLKPPPLRGVFAVRAATQDGKMWPAVANLGQRPTLEGCNTTKTKLAWRLEVHVLGFEGNLYGTRLRVEFHHKLRDEQKFANQAALVRAIHQDIAAAKDYWDR